ncbi:hypothetical protein NIES4073_02700 (plasmid) [Kalymmatonema gypsitolerans NIES-4073]|nr:hypothetical protein NIES4073_02700 [Scytonema sp. NIES-4073]
MAFAVFRDVIEFLSKPGKDGWSEFDKLTISPMLQFGTDDAPYFFQELLPERLVSKNQGTEGNIEYRSTLAASGSSYAPTDINKGGQIIGTFDYKLGFTNQKDVLDVATYEAIHDILQLSDDSANLSNLETAAEAVLDWTNQNIIKPQMDLNELFRSQAIIDALVKRRGANGYYEDVRYPNSPGQRVIIPGGTVAAPLGWYKTDGSYDSMLDLQAIQTVARKKGLEIVRIASSWEPKRAFMNNPAIKNRFSGVAIAPGAGGTGISTSALPNMVTEDGVDALLRQWRLPAWELYDKTYNYKDANGIIQTTGFMDKVDGTGKKYNPVILTCRTRREWTITLPNPIGKVLLTNTLGYFGIGRCVGHQNPGRVLNRLLEDKLHPPSFTAEVIQEGLPILTAPEAHFVLNVYEPTP